MWNEILYKHIHLCTYTSEPTDYYWVYRYFFLFNKKLRKTIGKKIDQNRHKDRSEEIKREKKIEEINSKINRNSKKG